MMVMVLVMMITKPWAPRGFISLTKSGLDQCCNLECSCSLFRSEKLTHSVQSASAKPRDPAAGDLGGITKRSDGPKLRRGPENAGPWVLTRSTKSSVDGGFRWKIFGFK